MSTDSPPGPVAVLDRAVSWTHDCLQLARRSPLSTPTPCREWDLGQLLEHMEDSLLALAEAADLGEVDLAPDRVSEDPLTTAHPVDRVIWRACSTRAAWHRRLTSAPIALADLVLGCETITLVGALEVAVHGWDVAQAIGYDAQLPEDLALQLYDVAMVVVTPEERGRRFAEPHAPTSSAPAGERLLAHLGRQRS